MKQQLSLFIFLITETIAISQSKQRELVVAKDVTGNYKTIQEAFDAVPGENKDQLVILIRNGIYKEKLELIATKEFVTMIGQDKFNAIITYDDHTGKKASDGTIINKRSSRSILIAANNFTGKKQQFPK